MQKTKVQFIIKADEYRSVCYDIWDLNTKSRLKNVLEFNEAKKYLIQEHFISTYKTKFKGSIVCPDSGLIMVY